MTIIQVIILSIVEGVTEFLPISSTGHLILTSKLLGIPDSNFLKSFEIAIQFGAILAVVVLYFKKLITDFKTWKKVLIAFFPTAVIGFLFYKIIKYIFLSSSLLVVWSLFLGGFLLILFELWYQKNKFQSSSSFAKFSADRQKLENKLMPEISYKRSFWIGVWQSIAAIPGVSRSGATIIGGMAMGISREAIVEFSFLLAVPTMAAATGYDLLNNYQSFSFDQFYILTTGFIVSFFVALISVKWLIYFIKKHTFISFGVYRIVASVLFYFLVVR